MALVSHHSGSLDTSGVVASLQQRGHTVTVRGDTIIGTPCTLNLSNYYWNTLYPPTIIGTPCTLHHYYWNTLYPSATIIGTPCTLHLLPLQVELLQHTDVRPNLARVRQSEARTVIVDISAHLIKPFLYQVITSLSLF